MSHRHAVLHRLSAGPALAGCIVMAGALPARASAPTEDVIWFEQIGGPGWENAYAMALDSAGNAFVTGDTLGFPNVVKVGADDAFIAKVDPDGSILWSGQIGSDHEDVSHDLALDDAGNIFLTGFSRGDLAAPNAGGADIIVSMINPQGQTLWTRQFGTPQYDIGYGIEIDANGDIIIAGQTKGSLAKIHEGPGNNDVFIAKLVVPEPTSIALLGLGGLGLVRRRSR